MQKNFKVIALAAVLVVAPAVAADANTSTATTTVSGVAARAAADTAATVQATVQNAATTAATGAAAKAAAAVAEVAKSPAVVSPVGQPNFLSRGYNSAAGAFKAVYNEVWGAQTWAWGTVKVATGTLAAYAVYRLYNDCAASADEDVNA